MVYHRQTKIKNEYGKSILQPTKAEVNRRKIKHLQRYIKKIKEAKLENLPQISNKLYNYAIKKSILEDENFLKTELISQIEILIDSLRHTYSPVEIQDIQKFCLTEYFVHSLRFRNVKDLANSFTNTLGKNFYSAKYCITKYLSKIVTK